MPVTEFRELHGGLNTRRRTTEIDPSEAQSLLNVEFYERDIAQRLGFRRLNNTQAAGAGAGLGLVEFDRRDGTRRRVAKFGTTVFTFDGVDTGANVTLTQLLAGVNGDRPFQAAVGDNRLVIANSGDTWVYDATTIRRVGIAAPATTPVLADGGAGSLSAGTYQVRLRFRASSTGAESPATAAASITLGAARSISVTIAAPDLATLDGYYDVVAIYVTTAGGATFFRSGTTTTSPYVHNQTDATLSAQPNDSYASEPIGVLAGERYVVYLHGRAFYAGETANPSRLRYSQVNQPDLVLTNNFIDVFPESYGRITGLAVFFDQVVIFKQSAIVVFTPTGTTTTWQVVALVKGTGAIDGGPVTVVGNRVYFLDERGIFAFDGIAISLVSERVEGTIVGQTERTREQFFVGHHDIERKQYVLGFTRLNQARNDREIVLHYDVAHPRGGPPPFGLHDVEATSYGLFHDGDGNLISVFTDRIGFLYRRNVGDRDGPTAALTGTVTAATATTLSDTTTSPFQTGGSHVLGFKVAIVSGTGVGQVREITVVNSASQVTVDSAWTTTPDTTSVYHVGAISSHWRSRDEDFGSLSRRKRVNEVVVASGSSSALTRRVLRRALYHSVRFENLGADQPWRVKGYSLRWSPMDHRSPGAGAVVTTTVDMV